MKTCENISDSMVVEYIASRITTKPEKSLSIMLSSFVILGLLGNSLVIYAFVAKRNKLSSTVFIIALACNDFLISVIVIPYTMIVEGLKYQGMGDVSCKLYHFITTCTVHFSVFIMLAIAIDRYICICRPCSHSMNGNRARNIVIALLTLSFTFGAITAMFFGVYIELDTFRKYDVISEPAEEALSDGIGNMIDVMTGERGHCQKCLTPSRTTIFTDWFQEVIHEFYATFCNPENLIHETRIYTGYCHSNKVIFPHIFFNIYQIIYSSLFLLCFFVIFVLYILIYRSVMVRRARRFEEKTKTKLSDTSEKSLTQNQTGLIDSPSKNVFMMAISIGCQEVSSTSSSPTAERLQVERKHVQEVSSTSSSPTAERLQVERKHVQENDHKLESNDKQKERSQTDNGRHREKYHLANIRTAIMLFVVTVVFVIVYLPAWLMSFDVIMYNVIIFYVYLSNHILNPIIYAFINPTFRRSLQDLMCGKKRWSV